MRSMSFDEFNLKWLKDVYNSGYVSNIRRTSVEGECSLNCCGRYSENEKEETGEILVEFAYIRGQKSL